jgi:hypothetical protein
MLPEKRIPTHPGEILLVEFLSPMGMTQLEFSTHFKETGDNHRPAIPTAEPQAYRDRGWG